MLKRVLLSSVVSLVAANAFANINDVDFAKFATADAQFELRETLTAAETKAAIAAYEKLIPSLKGDDLFYAVGQANKMSLYYGQFAVGKSSDAEKKERQDVFGACVDRTEALSPAKVGAAYATEFYANQYYYWRMSCMALQAEFANILVKGKLAATLIDIRDLKLKIKIDNSGKVTHQAGNACYQGGGIFRVMAGILSNPAAKVVGMYQPDQASVYADYALTYKADFDNYCDLDAFNVLANYRYKADALVELGKKADASKVLETALCRFAKDAAGNCNVKAPVDSTSIMAAIDADDAFATTLPEAHGDLGEIISLYNELNSK